MGLIGQIRFFVVLTECIKSGSPSVLKGDLLFNFKCESCGNGEEEFERIRLQWSVIIYGTVHKILVFTEISAPSQLKKNEQKLPKMVYIISNFLVVHFGENFMKIGTKIPKYQMHGKLHKNVNEFTLLCNFS